MKQQKYFIEYFFNNKRIGSSYVKEGSDSIDRVNEARKRGILYYNRFILDKGRWDTGKMKNNTNNKNTAMLNDFKYLKQCG